MPDAYIAEMAADPAQKCYAVLNAVVSKAETNGIPLAENAIDEYVASFKKDQQLASLQILDQDFSAMWANPTLEQMQILETIGDYIAKRLDEVRDDKTRKRPE